MIGCGRPMDGRLFCSNRGKRFIVKPFFQTFAESNIRISEEKNIRRKLYQNFHFTVNVIIPTSQKIASCDVIRCFHFPPRASMALKYWQSTKRVRTKPCGRISLYKPVRVVPQPLVGIQFFRLDGVWHESLLPFSPRSEPPLFEDKCSLFFSKSTATIVQVITVRTETIEKE